MTVDDATTAVTIEIGTNPGGGALSGTTTVNAVNGIATFPDLSIDEAGDRYTFVATSGSLGSVTSTAFDILDSPARIDTVILDSTTLMIGGPNVPYTATLTNGSADTLSWVVVQAYIDQGTVSHAAGGGVVGGFSQCGGEEFDFPRGSCTFQFTVLASNSHGEGTLVEGDATARFVLHWNDVVLDTYPVPVTLTN